MTGNPNPPAPFDRDELLELASLEALGLLDDYDAAMFARCFHNAPVALQREIMDRQAELAVSPSLLPDVEPPAGLRDRVVDRVAQAAALDETHAPLAMIGPSREFRSSHPGRSGRRLLMPSGVWRAASFLLIGALIVSLFFNLRTTQDVRDITIAAQSMRFNRDIEELLGRDALAVWADRNSTTRILRGSSHLAAIVVSDRDEAYFIGFNLPQEQMRLVGRDSDGRTLTVELRPNDVACAVRIESLTQAALAGYAWELERADGTVIAIA